MHLNEILEAKVNQVTSLKEELKHHREKQNEY